MPKFDVHTTTTFGDGQGISLDEARSLLDEHHGSDYSAALTANEAVRQALALRRQAAEPGGGREVMPPLPDGIKVTVTPSTPDDPQFVVVLTMIATEGRYRTNRIVITDETGSGSVDSQVLRNLPVTQWSQQAIFNALLGQSPTAQGWSIGESIDQSFADDGPTDQALRTFAAIYKYALAAGAPPLKTVQEFAGFGKPKASDWTRRAREAGFLPPTTRGKANG